MLEVFRMVGRVANSPATVLILGESGTGKELVATAIHRNSGRAAGPFVAINCAAIPENLLESELFGHEKGAFTGAIARKVGRFERASGGTLLLDEVGDMSLALQSKILRALQEREIERVGGDQRIPIDVRVVAATNKNLRAAIADGSFREDLYFRLAVVTLQLPRLVSRGGDLDLLIRHLVAVHAARYGREVRGISRAVFQRLHEHDWPGNIRELRNVLERAVLLSHGRVLLVEHLPLDQLRPPSTDGPAMPLAGYAADLTLAEVEKLHIREVLLLVKGHLGKASEVLGVHRNTLTRKIREYGLESTAGSSNW
jgi:DNA-binding NtrC family response regulator